ncbi:uncharacterized protein LOC130903901 [Diorhabda carinulata]|uniref:uncharacterized protein LOC130903901 n=1 Tax=Diorhabda carinulata TaxID=1163345 RepID=UPI00259FE1E2|nr:uncharacterized protein LOC130903901 [Diorhabda carinulata]
MYYHKFYNTVIFFFIFGVLHVKSDQVKNEQSKNIQPGKESALREGDCAKAVLADMVYQDHVRKPGIPFITRNATLPWHGDAKIYCVIVEPDREQTPGARVSIKDGGINHTFVNLEIVSKTGEGLDYVVQVFGKNVK